MSSFDVEPESSEASESKESKKCSRCFLDLNIFSADSDVCPNCGAQFSQSKAPKMSSVAMAPGAPFELFKRFFSMMVEIIFKPTEFFRKRGAALASAEGLSSALVFAVIVQWFSSFFNFIWRSTVAVWIGARVKDLFNIAEDIAQNNPQFSSFMSEGMDEFRQRAYEFLFGAGAVVLTPFLTLLKLFFVTLFVHAAVRFFMTEDSERKQSYSTTLKVLAYSTAPSILSVIPGLGMILGGVLSFVCAVIGLREVYKSSTGKSMIAVLFPNLLILALILLALVIVVFAAFGFIRLIF